MLSPVFSVRRSAALRVLYTCFTIIIFSYVFSDLLGLDGSNSPKVSQGERRTVVETSTAAEPDLDISQEQCVPWQIGADLFMVGCDEKAQQRGPGNVQVSLLYRVRDDGYRPGLARSSLPEKSPDD